MATINRPINMEAISDVSQRTGRIVSELTAIRWDVSNQAHDKATSEFANRIANRVVELQQQITVLSQEIITAFLADGREVP